MLRQKASEVGGRNALAKLLDVSPTYLGRVLSGEKPISPALAVKLSRFRTEPQVRRSVKRTRIVGLTGRRPTVGRHS